MSRGILALWRERWGKGDDGLMEGIQPQSYDELEVFREALVSIQRMVPAIVQQLDTLAAVASRAGQP